MCGVVSSQTGVCGTQHRLHGDGIHRATTQSYITPMYLSRRQVPVAMTSPRWLPGRRGRTAGGESDRPGNVMPHRARQRTCKGERERETWFAVNQRHAGRAVLDESRIFALPRTPAPDLSLPLT